MNVQEGKIEVDGHQVWYRRVNGGGIPLLTLHGGPGAGHEYLKSLEMLGRSVIFYDQLGCGNSDSSDDCSLWQLDRFVSEIDLVRHALGLTQIHLFGQSYGGWLALEYILTHPSGVLSLILASTSASVAEYVSEMHKLRAGLPRKSYEIMKKHEERNDFLHPDYQAAYFEFLRRHMCRLEPWPELLIRTTANINNFKGYSTMWGPNEFEPIGNLKDWDRTSNLSEINLPTLITVGRYDEMPLTCADTLYRGISDSQMAVFEESAHMAHVEETERYLTVVADFLEKVESMN